MLNSGIWNRNSQSHAEDGEEGGEGSESHVCGNGILEWKGGENIIGRLEKDERDGRNLLIAVEDEDTNIARYRAVFILVSTPLSPSLELWEAYLFFFFFS